VETDLVRVNEFGYGMQLTLGSRGRAHVSHEAEDIEFEVWFHFKITKETHASRPFKALEAHGALPVKTLFLRPIKQFLEHFDVGGDFGEQFLGLVERALALLHS